MAEGLDVCVQHGWTGSLVSFLSAAGQTEQYSADLSGLLETRKIGEAIIRSAQNGREVRLQS